MGVRQLNEKEELRAAMWFQGNFFLHVVDLFALLFSLYKVHLKNKI